MKLLFALAVIAFACVEAMPQRDYVYYRNGRAYVDYLPPTSSAITATAENNCRPGEYLALVAPYQNTYACLDRNSGTSDGIYRDGRAYGYRSGRTYEYEYPRSYNTYTRWDPETRSYYRYRE